MGEADGAGGITAVAAALVIGCAFQHQHLGALFPRRQRRRQRRVSGADHDNIGFASAHLFNILIKALLQCIRAQY